MDLFFDDWGTGSDLAAGATLPDVTGGGMDWLTLGSAALKALPALGGLAGGKSGPSTNTSAAASSLSQNLNLETVFDNSGWVVNFGRDVTTERTQVEDKVVDQDSDAGADAKSKADVKDADAGAASWLPYVALLFGGVILWRMVKG